ncbi:MAG: hypothetical protein ABI135_10570 [Rhodoferax sp.]
MSRAYGIFSCARLLCVVSLCGLTLSAALAQDSNAFNGKWTASYFNSYRSAQVVIADGGGSWETVRRGGEKDRLDPCLGREFPLTVTSHTENEIVFEVDTSKGPGCKNFGATLKVVDANTLEGTFPKGTPLKLVRR